MEKPSEKERLRTLLLTHLKRTPVKKEMCENFSSLYNPSLNSESQTDRARCLLDEYTDSKETTYFDMEEARKICSYFRHEQSTKCDKDGYLPREKIRTQEELENLLERFRNKAKSERKEPD